MNQGRFAVGEFYKGSRHVQTNLLDQDIHEGAANIALLVRKSLSRVTGGCIALRYVRGLTLAPKTSRTRINQDIALPSGNGDGLVA